MSNLSSSILLRALRGERAERPPIWLMRQAGRYLPEYRALRAKHSMLEAIQTPALAAEITLQPLRRFPLDAAIIFSDILPVLTMMGLKVDFEKGVGPVLERTLSSPQDVSELKVVSARQGMDFTLEAISRVAAEINPTGLPVLGFSGAPFTLATYAIEGSPSKNLTTVKEFMFHQPSSWDSLQQKLRDVVADYLVEQVKAGASAVQLFDSWAGHLSPLQFRDFVAPYLREIISRVKSAVDVPIIYFATAGAGLLPQIGELGADVIGIDWRIGLGDAAKLLGSAKPLQGNLDPLAMLAPWQHLKREVEEVIKQGRAAPSHIFNLGHGILPETPIENVEKLVSYVRNDK